MPEPNVALTEPVPAAPLGHEATLNPGARSLDRVDWLSFACTTGIAFGAYLYWMAPDVTLEMAGIYVTGANYGGVTSPPGHPAWTLYSWLFIKMLPISNVAWRVAVGSAVASTAACGMVALLVSRAGALLLASPSACPRLSEHDGRWTRWLGGVIAGLGLAFSNDVWSSALVAGTSGFCLMLFVGILFLLSSWMLQPSNRRPLCGVFFLAGLLLTSNQEAITLLPPLLIAISLRDRELVRDLAIVFLPLAALVLQLHQYRLWFDFPARPNWPLVLGFGSLVLAAIVQALWTHRALAEGRCCAGLVGCFGLGLATYLELPLAALTHPPVDWGYASTVEGFLHMLRRGQFAELNPTSDLGRLAQQLLRWPEVATAELGWPYLVLAFLGTLFPRRMPEPLRRWLTALLIIGCGMTGLLTAEINPPLDHAGGSIWRLYYIPTFAMVTILSGSGVIIAAANLLAPRVGTGRAPAAA